MSAAAHLLLTSPVACSPARILAPVGTPTTIVLTFDDGPFPPDVRDPVVGPDDENLLDSLRSILATLKANDAQAVFYVVGPDDTADSPAFRELYAKAIREMHDQGEIIGYHAYHHVFSLWVAPFRPFPLAFTMINNDLLLLERFLDETLPLQDLARGDVISPVFRQPYGGGGIRLGPARVAANVRRWTYHGFRIDSADWTVNADASPGVVARLPVSTEADRVAFVLSQLKNGATRNAGRPIVDVLFHVNALTAEHLQEWIDELREGFTVASGIPPVFAVPTEYLTQTDAFVDLSVASRMSWIPRKRQRTSPMP